jgi:hypothetical protein
MPDDLGLIAQVFEIGSNGGIMIMVFLLWKLDRRLYKVELDVYNLRKIIQWPDLKNQARMPDLPPSQSA